VRKVAALGLTTSQYTSTPVETPLSPPPSSCNPPTTISSRQGLEKDLRHCPPGTIAFLQDEQSIVFKVDSGWRYLMAGRLVAVGEDKEEEAFYTDSTYSWGQ